MARARIGGLVSLLIGLCSFGCNSDRDPSAKPTKAEPPPRPQPAAPAELQPPPPIEPPAETPPSPQFDSLLGGRFALAAAGLAHAPAEPRDGGPSWQAPGCKLEYQFRIHAGNGDVGGLPSMTLITGSWTARAEAPGMILKNGEVRLAHVAGSTRRLGESVRAGSLAEIRLQTDGRAWTEIDGPTSLWSAYGSWAGLTKFYPALPEAGAPGSSASWQLLVYERSAGGRVEGERGSLEVPEGVELPEPEPTKLSPSVTLERWIELGGATAAVLRSWSEYDSADDDGSTPDDLQVHEISQGQYVVLDSGVLLHAELHERATFDMSGNKFDLVVDGEARLVRGCGGPVLPRVSDEPTAPERALEAVARLRDLALAGDREQLVAMLDTELRAAEPEAPQCLIHAIERYGVGSLGEPELPLSEPVRERNGRVTLELPGATFVFVISPAALTLASLELRESPTEVLLRLELGTARIAEAGCSPRDSD